MTPLDRLVDAVLDWLAAEIVDRLPPKRPKPVSAHLVNEDGSMLVYDVTFPPVTDPDVKTRKLSVNIDGTSTDHEFGAADAKHEVRAMDGQVVILTLVDIDDATPPNASLPSAPFQFTATDTIAPAQPGALGATLVREEPDEPTPTP